MKLKILSLILTVMTLFACNHKKQVDLIVYDAKVYAVDGDFSVVSAFAVKDGKFVATGSSDEIMSDFKATTYYDAGQKAVYPGFNDGHSHFLGYATTEMFFADLVGTGSFDEVLERVKNHSEIVQSGWILGRGWDQNDWEQKSFPVKEKLDKLFPDTPVALRRIDGHALLVNSKALEIAGIDDNTAVEGGEIIKINGHPSGILIDNAMGLVSSLIPDFSEEQKTNALVAAANNCYAVGLTTVTDAGLNRDDVLLMDSLQQSGKLGIRIYAMLSPTEENFKEFFPKGIYKSGMLTVSSVKLYVDGALGSRGALLLEPYSDDAGNYGLKLAPDQYYKDICERAFKAGFQVNTHAIGDSGNRLMLKTYAEFLGGKNDKRWRVEHAQVVNPDDMHYFSDFSIIPSVQATHCTSDMYWAEDRLGPERIRHAYAYKDLLQTNGWIINGTDFPVEDISPLKTFYAAVARRDEAGWPEGGFQTENALTREEALRSVTLWPAKGSFEESFKGSIESGKVADFVVMDSDIMTVNDEDIPKAKVVATYINGKKVYDSTTVENGK